MKQNRTDKTPPQKNTFFRLRLSPKQDEQWVSFKALLLALPQWSTHKLLAPLTGCRLQSPKNLNSRLFYFSSVLSGSDLRLQPNSASDSQHKRGSSSSFHCLALVRTSRTNGKPWVTFPGEEKDIPSPDNKRPKEILCFWLFFEGVGGFWTKMLIKTKFSSRAKQNPWHGGNMSFWEPHPVVFAPRLHQYTGHRAKQGVPSSKCVGMWPPLKTLPHSVWFQTNNQLLPLVIRHRCVWVWFSPLRWFPWAIRPFEWHVLSWFITEVSCVNTECSLFSLKLHRGAKKPSLNRI